MLVINATAAKIGGAKTIVIDVVRLCAMHKVPTLLFSGFNALEGMTPTEREYVNVKVIEGQGRLARVLWDEFGFKKELRRLGVVPRCILSLQNTVASYPGVFDNYVYLHQPLPISEMNWSLFDRSERAYWFYKHIYPIFMRRRRQRVKSYFCQGAWMKPRYAKLLGVDESKIVVSRPLFNVDPRNDISVRRPVRGLFYYPALYHPYKGHAKLVEAVKLMVSSDPVIYRDLKVVFTIEKGAAPKLEAEINKYGLNSFFDFVGLMPLSQVRDFYNRAAAMLFPSELETFGLPLLEAAEVGCPVIAFNKPFVTELLVDYPGLSLCDSTQDMANAISKIYLNPLIDGGKPNYLRLSDQGWNVMAEMIF